MTVCVETDTNSVSVWVDFELVINEFSLSSFSISPRFSNASSTSWRLLDEPCLRSVLFRLFVSFVKENKVGTASAVRILLVGIPSSSF